MKWIGGGLLAALLALPAAWGDDPPKDKDREEPPKDTEKVSPAKEQYDVLTKEYSARQKEVLAELRKAKGDERKNHLDKYYGLGKEFADKFYKLAEDNPKDPAATDALFWIVQNAAGSEAHKKATEKVTALIGELPLNDLYHKLMTLRGGSLAVLDAVSKRAEKDEKDPMAGTLLGWVATNGAYQPAGQKAIDRLIEKYPDHASIERVCRILGQSDLPTAEASLKKILEKSTKPKVQAAAALGLGQLLATRTDELGDKPAEADKVAAEGEKYFTKAIDLYGNDSADQQKSARAELKALQTLRVGKPAPDIKAPDLDGKEFKLSDYRGKVVLLDFWGNW
jgi:hypothetical protein